MNGSLRAQCIAEFLGTGLFLFFGICCLSALKLAGASLGLWEICIIWGLGISLAVYLTAGISGGHLNPAVTVALWLFACFPGRKVLPYIVAQVAGAFGGAVLAWILYSTLFTQFETVHHMVRGSLESLQLASIFSTYPAPELSIWHAALVEVVITSMLMGMIMALTDDGNGVPKGTAGAAVDWHSGSGDRRLDRAAYRFCDEPGARFWPEIICLARRVGRHRDDWWKGYSLFYRAHHRAIAGRLPRRRNLSFSHRQ
ncbi:MIP family channel proteins [Klebsiella variicola]|nr:MIP family channel proteins [Klebsiella variicola]